MSADAITSLIGSLGFPIVCCGVLFYYIDKRMKEFFDKVESSLNNLSTSIQDNTTATSKLVTTVELLMKIRGDDK